MRVLQLTAHFSPNIGGVETHLDDLVNALIKRKWYVTVLTYRPLTTRIKWKMYENSSNLLIIRIPWLPYFFYLIISLPLLEFLYLFPGLFFITPLILIVKNPDVIHAHGLVAGFVGVFWGKLFNKRVIVSTHSIYSFPKKGMYRNFAAWIFRNASYCLGLSKKARDELLSLGINKFKVNNFTYWLDLEKFKRIDKAKFNLDWDNKFIILFVGRLVSEKGLNELLESAKNWDLNINLKIIGSGPFESKIKKVSSRYENIEFIGVVNQDKLPIYYSGSDILIVPSISEEGFGRVILEALACGTPIIGANRGAIPEAISKEVGELIDISPKKIKNKVEYFYNHKDKLRQLAKNCRSFAERRYSEKNVQAIIDSYRR